MTARKPTGAKSDNSGVNDDRIDRNKLLEIIRQRGGATIKGLAKRTGLPEREVRWMVIDLEEAQRIDVRQTFHSVHVEPTEEGDPITDGGVIASLMNAVAGEQPSVDLTEDELFKVIRNERRRKLIRLFAGVHNENELTIVKVGKLAETLARAETNSDTPITAQDRRRQYISLIQSHLPLLDESGVIEYFERPKKVRVDEDAVLIADVVDSIGDLCDGTDEQRRALTEIDASEVVDGGD
jgi:hypothetical protein